MAIKEVIQERARQTAREYRDKYINEQKGEYEKVITEYESLLTEQYQLEFRLDFLRALDRLKPVSEKRNDMEELKQRQIVLLKKTKDIENSGALEGYDAVMEAIRTVSQEGSGKE